MLSIIHLKEGLRIFNRSRYVKKKGIHRYAGNAEEICRQIVKGCWNGTYFQTSLGHYNQFWTRDFCWCAESLMQLGYREEVKKTLEFALKTYKKHNKITTTISPEGVPFDFPTYAVDSVPYLIHSLAFIKEPALIEHYKSFLNKEIKRFYRIVINKKTGLVKKKHFSSMKDHSIRVSSCYDNSMVAMLNNDLQKIEVLTNPLVKFDSEKRLRQHFWKETHFIDDLSGKSHITGDANVFPFWTGAINDKKMLASAIKTVQALELDKPFPLRYQRHNETKMHFVEFFAYGYERLTSWMHMGPLYIKLVQSVNKKQASEYIRQYREIIEKHQNYLEVYYPDKSPFESPFYYADEGMLWAANYLTLVA